MRDAIYVGRTCSSWRTCVNVCMVCPGHGEERETSERLQIYERSP
jgi:hypothetical protein